MNISVIGVGYVGLCSGLGFALSGHNTILVNRTKEKADNLNKGISPIYEPGVEDALKKTIGKSLKASINLEDVVKSSDAIFVCVGTPSRKDGTIDLEDVKKVSEDIGKVLKKVGGYKIIVVKSTVAPGTTEQVVIPRLEKVSGKKVGKDFGVCMNPEVLREGKALDDFLKPDRIVIGEYDKISGDVLESIYSKFGAKKLRTGLKTAEMIKYASNSMLATKITFVNEVGNICKLLGIDVYSVMEGVGLDYRIGPHFLRAGCGFGGSCFPKDVAALVAKAKEVGYNPKLLSDVLEINKKQKVKMVEMLKEKIDVKGKKIAVLGLAFNPDTDDIRESPALDIITELLASEAIVVAYDPVANQNTKALFPDVTYVNSVKEALQGSDACLLVTDCKEFGKLKDTDFRQMRNKIVIEGRRVLDRNEV